MARYRVSRPLSTLLQGTARDGPGAMRNVRTGAHTENRFRSEERVERVTLDQVHMEFLYRTAMTSTS